MKRLLVGGMAAAEREGGRVGGNRQTEKSYVIGGLENVIVMKKWKRTDERNTQHARQ